MNELMSCFAALLKEYKGEVEDILVADKQVQLVVTSYPVEAYVLLHVRDPRLPSPLPRGQRCMLSAVLVREGWLHTMSCCRPEPQPPEQRVTQGLLVLCFPVLQLAKEILYDIKQAELAKQQQHKAAGHGHPAGAAAASQHPEQPEAAAAADAADAAAAAAGTSGVAGASRSSPPPAGVLPGTPVAAEVLKTAERQRRLKQQQQAGAGEMPPPSPRAPPTGMADFGGVCALILQAALVKVVACMLHRKCDCAADTPTQQTQTDPLQ